MRLKAQISPGLLDTSKLITGSKDATHKSKSKRVKEREREREKQTDRGEKDPVKRRVKE